MDRFIDFGDFFIYTRDIERLFISAIILLAFYLIKSNKLRVVLVIFSLIWIKYANALVNYFVDLASDSLLETITFNYREAISYIKTVASSISNNSRKIKEIIRIFIGSLLIALVYIYALKYLFKIIFSAELYPKMVRYFVLGYVIFAFCYTIIPQVKHLIGIKNIANEEFAELERAFLSDDEITDTITTGNETIKLVVYIGEATSAQNMGIYGYYRETTPHLSALKIINNSLIVGKNYVSTHTHTSQSLLEALSISTDKLDGNEQLLTISQRKRHSIVSLLKASDIYSALVSSQSRSGIWNYTKFFIFGTVEDEKFISNCYGDRYFWGKNCETILEHQFFTRDLTEHLDRNFDSSSVLFLHSYAGHAPYLKAIPAEFAKEYPDLFEHLPKSAIFMHDTGKRKIVNDYDAAVRYIDSNINEAIKLVESQTTPTVFLYFSDHGDAAYSNRGHDSSRFEHAMIRVPMFLFMNNKAQSQLAKKQEVLRKHLSSNTIKTLRDVPHLIKYLLSSNEATLSLSADTISPILIRRLSKGLSALSIKASDFAKAKNYRDGSDYATRNFVLAQARSAPVCFHKSNTIQAAIVASFSSGCLESDIEIEEKKIWINHPPDERNDLTFLDLGKVVLNYRPDIWLDAKNLTDQTKCDHLVSKISLIRNSFKRVLVEFPPQADMSTMAKCLDALKQASAESTYYISTGNLVDCAQKNKDEACRLTKESTDVAIKSGVEGLSFDNRGKSALQNLQIPPSIKLHTWGISHASAFAEDKNYDFIIPVNRSSK